MAADLHIHVLVPPCTKDDVRRLECHECTQEEWFAAYTAVGATPNIHIGRMSWIKAAVSDDPEKHVPAAVQIINNAVKDFPIVDDALIATVKAALTLPNHTDYMMSDSEAILAFIEQHRGLPVFAISW